MFISCDIIVNSMIDLLMQNIYQLDIKIQNFYQLNQQSINQLRDEFNETMQIMQNNFAENDLIAPNGLIVPMDLMVSNDLIDTDDLIAPNDLILNAIDESLQYGPSYSE